MRTRANCLSIHEKRAGQKAYFANGGCRGGYACSGGGVVAAGLTNLCLALPGTIMHTGNYHFNARSIGGAAVCRGGHRTLTRAENGQAWRKEGDKRKTPFG